MNEKRVRVLNEGILRPGPILYWMSRDQRAEDNWALIYAQGLAVKNKVPLVVVFCLVPDFLGATAGHYTFMLRGLIEVEAALRKKNIPFYILQGSPETNIPAFIKRYKVGMLITDFDPLKIKKLWKKAACKQVDILAHEVDAHNIVPCWRASEKQEYGAYTIRPKIKRLLPEFLENFPPLREQPVHWPNNFADIDWIRILRTADTGPAAWESGGIKPGFTAGNKAMRDFIKHRLSSYALRSNDPLGEAQSNLSPYLHFGQVSAQRVVLGVTQSEAGRESKEAFLEEIIIRRELSDNFCFYNEHYDKPEGFPAWARETLDKHRRDKRPYLYSLHDFENARTHDDLWNAAQTEMVRKGKMHGYMRMYWAKKILEWTESPEQAMDIAIYLNDKYELDGRDPNGYTGIAWSIGGVHDRAWGERNIFGKIRYMSYSGCKSKFDTAAYVMYSRLL